MTKILNFALKIKGGDREGGTCEVLRPCHPPKKKLERALTMSLPKIFHFLFAQIYYKKGKSYSKVQ